MKNEVEQVIAEGVKLKRAGDLKGALNCYLRAVDLDPMNSNVFISVGKTAHLLKEQNLAARSYLAAVHLMLAPIEKVIDHPEQLPDFLRMA
jgi:tetratricopeptide (TPR) repeat protein